MSAWVVSVEHINELVNAAYHVHWPHGSGDMDDWIELGQMLVDENYRSVNYRYRLDVRPHRFELKLISRPSWQVVRQQELGRLFKLIDCLEYQSCEHPEWRDSKAYKALDDLRRALCTNVDGYDAAPWGV